MRYDLTIDTQPQAFVIVVPNTDEPAKRQAIDYVKSTFRGTSDPGALKARVRLVSSTGGPLLLDATVADVLAMA